MKNMTAKKNVTTTKQTAECIMGNIAGQYPLKL